jgi:hypothetical protein
MPDLMTYMTQTGLLDEAELQDAEYDEYCKRVNEPCSYLAWQHMRAEWERLNKEYIAKYQHLPVAEYNAWPTRGEAGKLLIRMCEIEAAQGY